MQKTVRILTTLLLALAMFSCNKGETYADLKKKEKNAIGNFLQNNPFVGRINIINEGTFNSQQNTTDCSQNQFVLFEESGVYMQIVRKGDGDSMETLARTQPDSTITKTILCRFFEYNILTADTTCTNLASAETMDKIQCKYSCRSKSFEASFTEGFMKYAYPNNVAVPTGWLVPLQYIKLVRKASAGEVAKVRIIVPHASGHATASSSVTPYYYEISYQLGN